MTQLTLEQAASEISRWRKTKKTFRDPIPQHLWQAAIDLSPSHDYKIVAKTMGIGVSDLRKKLGIPVKPRKSSPVKSNITFSQLTRPNDVTTCPCIELVTKNGTQIKIFS